MRVQVFWCLGTTALLVSNCVVLLLLLLSDEIAVDRRKPGSSSREPRRGVQASWLGCCGGGSRGDCSGDGREAGAWTAPARTASTAFAYA